MPLKFALCLAAVVLASCSASTETYVIQGVTFMDGSVQPPISNANVVIRKGILTAAGPAAEVSVPSGAAVIPGRGRYIFPLDPTRRLAIGERAGFLLLPVNPALDPGFAAKSVGRMEEGRWSQFPQ